MDQKVAIEPGTLEQYYAETEHAVDLNLGEKTIHAKRMDGTWRRLKWMGHSVWLIFFFGPYLRLDDRQAVLFDIPNRQFHLFTTTVLPQDFWMLSLGLLFLALLLAISTAIAGRVYCGFFCFQTVWTDLYTLIEDRLEGPPIQRHQLDSAPWSMRKLLIKGSKHLLWLAIALFTGIAFVSWFSDAYQVPVDLISMQLSTTAAITIALFTGGTYFLAGFMREQACFWLCPYARIQSAMVDQHTLIPTYDFRRGEPRSRIQKRGVAQNQEQQGDCVDCNQCVAVCPTGVDIRDGLQEGCLMCALCIDACDHVMDKLHRPRGLVRFASFNEMDGGVMIPLLKRARVWVYSLIMSLATAGIVYGFSTMSAVELKVLHARQPLYVLQSDGSIQNRYTLKLLNKTNQDRRLIISASGLQRMQLIGADQPILAPKGGVTARTVFIRVPHAQLQSDTSPILFQIEDVSDAEVRSERQSMFVGP